MSDVGQNGYFPRRRRGRRKERTEAQCVTEDDSADKYRFASYLTFFLKYIIYLYVAVISGLCNDSRQCLTFKYSITHEISLISLKMQRDNKIRPAELNTAF